MRDEHANRLTFAAAMDGGLLRAAAFSEQGCEVSPFTLDVAFFPFSIRLLTMAIWASFRGDGFVSFWSIACVFFASLYARAMRR